MAISMKTIIFQGFREGTTFARWVQLFPGEGVKMPISKETHITCDFPGGGPDPYPPSGSSHATRNTQC